MSDEKVKELLGTMKNLVQRFVEKKDYGEANFWSGYVRALEEVLGEGAR